MIDHSCSTCIHEMCSDECVGCEITKLTDNVRITSNWKAKYSNHREYFGTAEATIDTIRKINLACAELGDCRRCPLKGNCDEDNVPTIEWLTAESESEMCFQ